ncbi:hypothetical protein PUN28_014949 [Cardiocondyla obscurior]|uniref:Uncharacterized protein n=1 Tax=Cardiocondyla obscurior TaxID=286306 RepID=A0AAW2EZZ8_9HYME
MAFLLSNKSCNPEGGTPITLASYQKMLRHGISRKCCKKAEDFCG